MKRLSRGAFDGKETQQLPEVSFLGLESSMVLAKERSVCGPCVVDPVDQPSWHRHHQTHHKWVIGQALLPTHSSTSKTHQTTTSPRFNSSAFNKLCIRRMKLWATASNNSPATCANPKQEQETTLMPSYHHKWKSSVP
jgi:hypothetical protein